MKKFKKMASTCAGVAALSTAFCVNAAQPLPIGWYTEANVGKANVSDINYATPSSNNASGMGWNINIGYKFMPFFGLEGGYTDYATTNAEFNNTKVAKGTSHAYDLVGKAILPIQHSGFEFFAKLGVSRARTHIINSNSSFAAANNIDVNAGTKNATNFLYGLGGEYAATSNVLVNAQWTRSDGGSTSGNLDLYSVGVAYLFG